MKFIEETQEATIRLEFNAEIQGVRSGWNLLRKPKGNRSTLGIDKMEFYGPLQYIYVMLDSHILSSFLTIQITQIWEYTN